MHPARRPHRAQSARWPLRMRRADHHRGLERAARSILRCHQTMFGLLPSSFQKEAVGLHVPGARHAAELLRKKSTRQISACSQLRVHATISANIAGTSPRRGPSILQRTPRSKQTYLSGPCDGGGVACRGSEEETCGLRQVCLLFTHLSKSLPSPFTHK